MRSRYVSHLVECDQCRRQVSDLALASGAITRAEQTVAEKSARTGFWSLLTGLFALPVLRYAALAAVLIAVGGVTFRALRHRSEPAALIARNEADQPQTASAVKPPTGTDGGVTTNANHAQPATATTQPSAAQPPSVLKEEQEALRTPDSTPQTLEPMKETSKAPESDKKAEASTVTQTKPAYAPAPPGESQSVAGGAVQPQAGLYTSGAGGPRQQTQQQMSKSMPGDRERDASKDGRLDDAARKSDQSELAARRANDKKLRGGRSRNMDN